MLHPPSGTGRTGVRSAAPRRGGGSPGAHAAWLLTPWLLLASCSSPDPRYVPVLTLDDSQASYGQVTLRWTYGGPLRQGYWIEVKEGDADWRVLLAALQPHWSNYPVSFDAASAETRYAFRMQAYSPSDTSGYGNEVEFFWIRPPAITTFAHTDDTFWSAGGYQLAWARQSLLPTEERLERSVEGLDASTGPWEPLPVAPGATSYQDTDLREWIDGARYRYRVVSRFEDHQMASVPAYGDAGPILPPAASATVSPDGRVGLSWTSRSRIADGVVIFRDAGQFVGTFPQGVTAAYDAVAPGLHLYSFTSTASDPMSSVAPRPTATLAVVVPDPAWSSPLAYSTAFMPGADAAVRTSAGGFALVWEYWGNGGELSVPDGSRWTLYPTGRVRFFDPFLLVDGRDGLHALAFDESDTSRSVFPVHHLWADGGGLHDELVDPGPPTDARRGLAAMADDGSLRAVWEGWGTMTFAANAGGAWALETFALPPGAHPSALAVEPSGATQVLVCSDAGCEMRRRDTGGSWAADAVPAATPPAGGNVRLLAPADGASLLAYDEISPSGDTAVWAMERDASGWHDPVLLGVGSVQAVALSPDRTRAAVGAVGQPSRLFLRGSGSWQEMPLVVTGWVPGLAVGFTPAGKAWALGGLGVGPPYVLYQEP
jgi:hypothetical protein